MSLAKRIENLEKARQSQDRGISALFMMPFHLNGSEPSEQEKAHALAVECKLHPECEYPMVDLSTPEKRKAYAEQEADPVEAGGVQFVVQWDGNDRDPERRKDDGIPVISHISPTVEVQTEPAPVKPQTRPPEELGIDPWIPATTRQPSRRVSYGA